MEDGEEAARDEVEDAALVGREVLDVVVDVRRDDRVVVVDLRVVDDARERELVECEHVLGRRAVIRDRLQCSGRRLQLRDHLRGDHPGTPPFGDRRAGGLAQLGGDHVRLLGGQLLRVGVAEQVADHPGPEPDGRDREQDQGVVAEESHGVRPGVGERKTTPGMNDLRGTTVLFAGPPSGFLSPGCDAGTAVPASGGYPLMHCPQRRL